MAITIKDLEAEIRRIVINSKNNIVNPSERIRKLEEYENDYNIDDYYEEIIKSFTSGCPKEYRAINIRINRQLQKDFGCKIEKAGTPFLAGVLARLVKKGKVKKTKRPNSRFYTYEYI